MLTGSQELDQVAYLLGAPAWQDQQSVGGVDDDQVFKADRSDQFAWRVDEISAAVDVY